MNIPSIGGGGGSSTSLSGGTSATGPVGFGNVTFGGSSAKSWVPWLVILAVAAIVSVILFRPRKRKKS